MNPVTIALLRDLAIIAFCVASILALAGAL